MFMLHPVAAACIFILSTLLPPAAQAALPPLLQPMGAGEIRMVPPVHAHDPGYCLLDRPYEQNFHLHIALQDGDQLQIGMLVPRAGFGGGDSHPMTLQLDDRLQRSGTAKAKTSELLIMNLSTDPNFLATLSQSQQLIVIGAVDHTSFALTGLAPQIDGLRSCVTDLKQRAWEFQAAAAWPQSLAALLAASGLHDAEPVPLTALDVERRPSDYAWRYGQLIGGVREQLVTTPQPFAQLVRGYNEAFREKCQGKFIDRLEPVIQAGIAQLQTGSIVCEMTERSVFVAALYTLTDAGVFTLYIHQGELAQATAAVKARDAMAATLRRFYADDALGRPRAIAKQTQ
jgi:hypothetical protein